jgi:hypothetical protein
MTEETKDTAVDYERVTQGPKEKTTLRNHHHHHKHLLCQDKQQVNTI